MSYLFDINNHLFKSPFTMPVSTLYKPYTEVWGFFFNYSFFIYQEFKIMVVKYTN